VLRYKRWAGNLLLVPVGLIVGTLALEIGLRLGGIEYPSFYTTDQYTGAALIPGAEGWYREETDIYIRINSQGLRDREHAKAKPANTLRIAVLGDSYAAAWQVPLQSTFWAVMEQRLEKCEAVVGQDVEAINFGISGYGTAQELNALRHRVWDYDPDIVVLAFFTGNDIRNNSRALEQDPLRPYFTYHGDELVLDESFVESAGYRVRQTSLARLWYSMHGYWRVLQLLSKVKNSFQVEKIAMERRAFASNDVIEELGLDSMIYLEPRDPVWEEAWRVTEGILVLMKHEVAEKGAVFLVATLSNPIQVHPDLAVRQVFIEALGLNDLFYPDSRIKILAEREGFSVLNLAQPFQAYAEEHQVFLHGFENTTLGEGHWNVEGHRLGGQMIAQEICSQLLNDGREMRDGR